MPENIKYICECCGKEHEEWPSLTYSSPTHYQNLTEEEKQTIAELSTDFCVIKYTDQTDKFIRCTLTQKVIDHCENLEYGLWVSLSDKSFENYSENFNNENHETKYFGWLSNYLPNYENTTNIPTTVYTKKGNLRPEIIPNEDFEHQFVKDYFNGITKKEAERRIREMLKTIENNSKKMSLKTKIIPSKMSKKAIIITTIGAIVGMIAGYAYYHFVGCESGTCAITSKPLNSTLYGGLLGGLLFNLFVKEEKQQQ